ncbi:MBL fold metallo-hydrolase [Curtobacterium ammoniigenes]|uniref:MBL fold metallo-hydrolase n=1 Tax=Curtobacterium ammoniigenes TaxID=395387 RepID=UPI00082AA1F2|nr:MBL fold metallo-hydrolase [Curtobacterium ammoniigenes]
MPASPLAAATVKRISERAWFAHSELVNWSVVRTPRGIVLVDAGYADQAEAVLASIATAADGAAMPDLIAILVTHAHTDHIGAIPAILERHPDVAVIAAEAEVTAVRGPDREQITVGKIGLKLLSPRVITWLRAAIGAGGLRETAIPSARAFTPQELARMGLRAVAAPGHTAGSTVFEVLGDDVLITGDAFVTDHAIYRRPRAGAIDPMFSADPAKARQTAERISRSFTILPGHGPALLSGRHSGA